MKNSIRLLFFVIGITFFASCSVSHVNNKLIIGNWKSEKIGPFISNNKSVKPKTDSLSDEQSLNEFKQGYQNAGKDQKRALKETMYSGFLFKEDKTAVLSLGSKEIHTVWKMNSKGNNIVLKDTATLKKYVIHIVSVDSITLRTETEVLQGKLQRSFKKQK